MRTGIDEYTINLSELGEPVPQGGDAIIGKAGKILFRVVPYDISGQKVEDFDEQAKPRRILGALMGQMCMAQFLDETQERFTGTFCAGAVFLWEWKPGDGTTRVSSDCEGAP